MAQFLPDASIDFSGGQDVSRGVSNVPDSRYYAGVNVTAKRGVLSPRWGFSRLPLTFEDGGEEDETGRTRTYREIFEGGKFQSATSFYINGDPFVVAVISGFVFLVNLTTNHVDNIPITGGSRLNGRLQRINRTVADEYVIFYDFPDYPVLVNGISARRADPTQYEVPPSRLGAFNQSRLFIVNGGNEFTGGDPVGNTAAINPPITFQEVLQSGAAYYQQIFQLPTDYNREPVTAAATLQAVDTSTGIGPLLVATANNIYAYGTHVPRSQWEAGQFGSLIVSNVGVVGPRAFVNANSDAFFISSDGHVRTISMSQNEQKAWSRIPISKAIENWVVIRDRRLLQFSVAAYFNNKIFISVNPYRVASTDFTTRLPISDYAFGGMVVLELDNVSTFGQATAPAWAGLWTGVRPMEFISADDRMFVFSKDRSSVNRLYEIDPNLSYDTADDQIRQVRSRVYTKSYSFQNPFNRKQLRSLELNMKDIKGDFSADVKYKVSHAPYFYDWRRVEHPAPWRLEDLLASSTFSNIEGHSIRDFIIGGTDANESSPVTDELINAFKEVQLYLELTGIYWELTGLRLLAVEQKQEYVDSIREYRPLALSSEVNTDWNYEEFGGCQQLQTL
jgi:hypothetical protein